MQDQTDVVKKWVASGLLGGVKPHRLQRAAERLEAAHMASRGGSDRGPIDRELQAMDREGYYLVQRG